MSGETAEEEPVESRDEDVEGIEQADEGDREEQSEEARLGSLRRLRREGRKDGTKVSSCGLKVESLRQSTSRRELGEEEAYQTGLKGEEKRDLGKERNNRSAEDGGEADPSFPRSSDRERRWLQTRHACPGDEQEGGEGNDGEEERHSGRSRAPIIVVKSLIPGGAAVKDGRLKLGDRLIKVSLLSLLPFRVKVCGEEIRRSVPPEDDGGLLLISC
ncbi:unnamed protein product [Protopolystoma xenopodis]|uniref:PDZ domain-containing protein n=1 Tax=Protopolystoma xenopodis TaxID=117903 RepID=A0A448XRC2_9PLAT|nr:unnamed protein product [Protopolystoma xenopodis]